MRKPLSLYIHIPFCVKKCNYCAFVSQCATDAQKIEYVQNLISEIKSRAKEFSGLYEVQTIYIGGGTPSVLLDGQISEILSCVFMNFVVNNTAEITIEANPSSLTPKKAKEYADAGITRVSLGLQSAQEKHLKTLGRLHTKETFATAIKSLKSAGIKNLNGDMILGLPNQTEQDVIDTATFLASLELKHISVYMLEVEDGTVFKRLADQNLLPLPNDGQVINLYNVAKTTLSKLGFKRYEISNFAISGYESKHNQNYWTRGEYLGLGLNAHSFMNGTRFANTSSLNEYNKYLSKGEIPLEYKEEITDDEAQEETIMLSLRTTQGINLSDFSKKFGKGLLETKKETIKSLASNGFLAVTPDYSHIFATDKGFMVLNKIISELIG